MVSDAIRINQQGESNSSIFSEDARIFLVAQANGGYVRTFQVKALFAFAQLRNMLAAEDSTIMPQECNYARRICPQRSEANLLAFRIGQGYLR